MKRVIIISLVLWLALGFSAQAGKKKGGKGKAGKAKAETSAPRPANAEVAFGGFRLQSGEVVEISAEKMNLLLDDRKATFSDQVLVKKGASTIYCDKLELKYIEAGEIDQLKAIGRVKLIEGGSFATGEELEYFKDKNLFYLRGNPKLVSKGQIVLGTEMIFDLANNRLKVTDPEIQFQRETENEPKGNEPKGNEPQ